MRSTAKSKSEAVELEVATGSLLRGIDILRAFRPGFGHLGNSELTAATGLPKATVSRITRALLEAGYLQFDPITSKYSLTVRVLTIGFSLLSNLKIIQVADKFMQPLASQLGCTASLAAPDVTQMVYLHRCSNDALPYFLSAGSTIEMAQTASGRVYLSTLSAPDRAATVARLAKFYPGRWPEIEKGIADSVKEFEQLGVCSIDRTWNRNIRSIAAPIFAKNGREILTLSCAAPIYAVEQSHMLSVWAPRLLYAAQSIAEHF